MSNTNKSIFRQKSLDRLSSPEKLDQLMRVVGPKGWWWLNTLGILVGVILIWSLFGRIPITVTGQGVLVFPRRVVQLQAPASGRLTELKIQSGDFVKKGQVIARIAQPDLQQQLQQQGQKLAELQREFQAETRNQNQQNQLDQAQIRRQRQSYQSQLRQAQTIGNLVTQKNRQALQEQRLSYQEQLRNTQALTKSLKQSLDVNKQLRQEGIITQDLVLKAEQAYLQNLDDIGSQLAQLKQLNAQEAQQEQDALGNGNSIIDLEAQLTGLDSQEEGLILKSQQSLDSQQQQLEDVQQSIAQLQQQLDEQSRVVSEYTGEILEVDAVVERTVNLGESLGNIQREEPNSTLVGVTYFTIGDGKQVKPGMEVQITPSTVKREDSGGIIAKVSDVLTFPVTSQEATAVIGDADVAKTLMAGGREIQVSAELQADPANFSGYKWSSGKGPQLQVSSGTTTTALVTVEERAPITFVIPLLRAITGLE